MVKDNSKAFDSPCPRHILNDSTYPRISVILLFQKVHSWWGSPSKAAKREVFKSYKDIKSIHLSPGIIRSDYLNLEIMEYVHRKVQVENDGSLPYGERSCYLKRWIQNTLANFAKYMIISNTDRAFSEELTENELSDSQIHPCIFLPFT